MSKIHCIFVFLFVSFFIFGCPELPGQNTTIMFYNVENLFDTKDDSTKNDNEFLPDGDKKWDYYRYNKKLNSIFKVISAVGSFNKPPDVIGFAEVENHQVLYDLCTKTPLEKFEYKIVHFESPDFRGIDVGLIYNPAKITVINKTALPVKNPDNINWATRDILYISFTTETADTFHLFVNHWPSRRGGVEKSESKRILAAQTLRKSIDSLYNKHICPNIIIMGDFNDEPNNNSINKVLIGSFINSEMECRKLINLKTSMDREITGSYKYRGYWQKYDQIIISSNLSNRSNAKVFYNNFILIEDSKYGGYQPFRTYLGPRYKGGYSDHLPVVIIIE